VHRALPVLLCRGYGIEGGTADPRLPDRRLRDGTWKSTSWAGRGQTALLVVGESKAQLSKRDIDRFPGRRLAQLSGGGQHLFLVLVTPMVSARTEAVALYLSYQFGDRSPPSPAGGRGVGVRVVESTPYPLTLALSPMKGGEGTERLLSLIRWSQCDRSPGWG
jgi:hypothetical protein